MADYRLDIHVGAGGAVSISGGVYTKDQTYILGTNTSGHIVQMPVPVRYGTVDSSYAGDEVRVKFDGQNTTSGPFKYISSYTPAASDRVVLLSDYQGSYVISGKLLP